jgi:hypothetical protein
MKKLVLLFFIVSVSITTYSQVSLGFRGGIGFTKLTDRPYYSHENNSTKPKFVPGLTFGVMVDVAVTDIFFMQLDVMYAQMGTKYDLPVNDPENGGTQSGTGLLKKEYNTVQFPLVAKFTSYDTKVNWYWEGGFFGSYYIDGKYSLTSDAQNIDESGSINFDNMHRGDFGFVIGLGIGTDIGKKASWSLNLRYNRGIIDLNKNPGISTAGYIPTTSRALTLTLLFIVI